MKKRLLIALTSIVATFVLFMTGCNGSTVKPITIKDAVNPTSGNGTFLVETTDYIYYINGVGTYTDDNTFGKVTKSSLLRTKTSDIGKENAASEVVLPKLLITSSNETGVFIDGNYVYYATPNTEKNKAGNVKSSEVNFYRYNLTTGKNDVTILSLSEYKEFKFVKNDGNVYLVYKYTETVDETEENHFIVYNANKANTVVYTSPAYTDLVLGDANTTTVYFSKAAYNEKLEQAESFYNVYKYTYGNDTETDVRVVSYDKTNGTFGDKKNFDGTYKSTQGFTFNLVNLVDGYLFVKQTNLDSTYTSISYYAYNGSEFNFLGYSNTEKDTAVSSATNVTFDNNVFSLYYLSAPNFIVYTINLNEQDKAKQDEKTILTAKATDCSLLKFENGVLYLYNSNGYICKLDTTATSNKLYRLADYKFKTDVKAFLPVIKGEYIIGIGAEDYSFSYVYAVKVASEDVEASEDVTTATEKTVKAYNKTLIGAMTETDCDSFNSYIEDTFED